MTRRPFLGNESATIFAGSETREGVAVMHSRIIWTAALLLPTGTAECRRVARTYRALARSKRTALDERVSAWSTVSK
jgi:hypothetical protein